MRNRGIPHDELVWFDFGGGSGEWRVHTQTKLFGSVEAIIDSDDSEDGLTPIQQASLDMIRNLDPSIHESLDRALRAYGKRYLGDEFDLIDEDDIYFACDCVEIPRLRDSTDTYALLIADSGVDEEHGVYFVVRNGDVLGCCHRNAADDGFDWDETDVLDTLTSEDA